MKIFLLTALFLVNYGISAAQEKTADCRIIRVIEVPLTKKPNVKTESKIAVLNICLTAGIPQQRTVIEVIRNGRKEFREFEIIKVFADQSEAKNYARENGLSDVDYGQQTSEVKQPLPNLRPFNNFYTRLAALIRTGEISLDRDYRIKIKIELLNERISDWQLYLPAEENRTLLLELLRNFAQAADESRVFQVVALKELDESIKNVGVDINLEGENANFVFRFTTNSAKSATKIAGRFKLLFATAAGAMRDQPGVEFYKNAAFEVEKDRVLFSTGISRRNLALYLRDW